VTREFIADDFLFEASKFSDVTDKSRKGVLRTIQGPLGEWDIINRNNRRYSEKLWVNVLSSDYVKEQTEYKTLYGEANHPQGRFEVDFGRVSHNIAEMHKVPEKKQVYGTIDILDTPLGNILNTLYEYGSVLGFSSRAGGSLIKRKDYVEVDEDSYHFITFDAVPFPSVKVARLTEGVDYNEKMDLPEEAHKQLVSIIESCTKKDREILKDFIYSLRDYNLDKELTVLEGINIDSSKITGAESIKDTTLCLLKESYLLNSKLNTEISTVRGQLKTTEQSLDVERTKIKSLEESARGYRDNILQLANEKSKLAGDCEALRTEFTNLKNTISLNEVTSADVLMYRNQVEMLEEDNKNYKDLVSQINREKALIKSDYDTLFENYKVLESTKTESTPKNSEDDVIAELGSAMKDLVALQEEHDGVLHELADVKKELHDLTEEKSVLVRSIDESRQSLKDLDAEHTENMSKHERELSSIKESYERKVSEALGKVKQYKADMVKSICRSSYGISEDIVLRELPTDFTSADVHIVCERLISQKQKVDVFSTVTEVEESKEGIDESRSKSRLGEVVSGSRRTGTIK
jgi:predicted  nucleic acid-binding Zn-ribbon protein